ncbi:universal stress protein [Frateuria terrea]|uniref:Nucleotide-binding universal stress protein, UspA family n=1 Tax=Frateuria terrea TaxID=529704 RepID=A0A1H6UPP3_9GAMM|nr:universal stress protein [Frateuria terrea]SEI94383.1 Nucleotide-binding universal stress protein, UspA family [Frateuria terrea]SFP34078.1 Nucleotide-binding universal stress protein, UspA family [Frateuria terrea]
MKILLPVDGSPSSHRAVRYVIRHWNGMPVAGRPQLVLLHVDPALSAGVTRYLSANDVSRFHSTNASAALRTARRTLARANQLFDEMHEIGDPASVIIQLASRLKCDLVAMGSHGWGALLSLVLGSVVVKVLAHSRVPVLVVR